MELKMMEDTFRLQQAMAAKIPSSGNNSENEEASPTTREPTNLPPDVLKEMGVLLYPNWQDWLSGFDEDDAEMLEVAEEIAGEHVQVMHRI